MFTTMRPFGNAQAAKLLTIICLTLAVEAAPRIRTNLYGQPYLVYDDEDYFEDENAEDTGEAATNAPADNNDETKQLQTGGAKAFAWFFLVVTIFVVITCFFGKITLALETCCDSISSCFHGRKPSDSEEIQQKKREQEAETQRRLIERQEEVANARTEFNLNVLRAAQTQANQQVHPDNSAAFSSPAVLRALEALKAEIDSDTPRETSFFSKINPFRQRPAQSSPIMSTEEQKPRIVNNSQKTVTQQRIPGASRLADRTYLPEPAVAAKPARTGSQLSRFE
ncbi:Oidioi.mRNA.OKI2018_I69.chr1.g369.t1.cds [Oikopleura dioica]|uniref:Oidioi.mRNA.OKI2018_I69.chr1.g369.t1.cds n=1 Tax=Oikopleura dioica TaxID=34765 RepID=A0ABN7SPN9_OIKDI|nr:Oidioi.mRNA.OKI2018_I69.chr1.g369.t1.cds [Oikopleura dioica]